MSGFEGALCVSGAALGAAVSALFLGSPVRSEQLQLADVLQLVDAIGARRPPGGPRHHSDVDCEQGDYFEPPQPPNGTTASKALARGRAMQRRRFPSDDDEIGTEDPRMMLSNTQHLEGGWEGFSMEDARKRNKMLKDNFQETTPSEVLAQLQRGNARFWTGCASRPERTAFERRALIMQQFPVTAVLGCSDSRVPTEVIFDQGLGDMFVVRVAGNCLATSTTASLQYAVHHLQVKVLMVMGHEGCGAIKAAGLPLEQIEKEPEELAQALKMMKEGLNEHRLKHIHDSRAYDREAVITNVRRQVEGLCQDEAIMQKVEAKELIVVGCFYEISSGIVDFFMEVTEAPAEVDRPQLVLKGAHHGVQSRMEYRTPKDGDRPTLAKGKSGFMLPEPNDCPYRPAEDEDPMTSPERFARKKDSRPQSLISASSGSTRR
ncbi:unnamed protein product [Polarella glacialis]|uniref:carbonic anhydrase n=1 Tax=Polarella glacialis TaxID=89957 RepID=A0A813EDY4_POLGL|nr:unnamed protein product [Polarella glacialis]